jgi:hypothetical protein
LIGESSAQPLHFLTGWFSSAMNFPNKYELWNYVVGKKKNEKPKPIVTIDLEDKDSNNKEKMNVTTGQDVVYRGAKSRDVIVCEDKHRSRNTVRQTKVKCSSFLVPFRMFIPSTSSLNVNSWSHFCFKSFVYS